MKLNKINVILIIVIILLFLVPALIYMINNHYNSMHLVLEKKVVEAAQNCNIDNKCNSNIITVNELIAKGYLDKIYDPISKELINSNSYANITTNEFTVVN